MSSLGEDAQALVQDPLVLTAALHKVRSWNQGGEVVDRIDIARFEAGGGDNLRAIGADLAKGAYAPRAFSLVPYPKKGGRLRHYCAPSMRDQLAFAVFGVLLAPYIEHCAPPFVFGNRWYRRLYRDHNEASWSLRPFNISDRRIYMPYRLDYGMFRRVCHWTERAMVRGAVDDYSDDGSWSLEQLDSKVVPSCCRPEYWAESAEGYWARLDLRLAYPSVSLGSLRKNLRRIASTEIDLDELDYPFWITKRMKRAAVRQLANYLCDLLEIVEFDDTLVGDRWVPDDTDQQLPSRGASGCGLPTGLAISGLLLNAALHHADQRIAETQDIAGNTGAFLRFADDMVVFSHSQDLLWAAVERVAKALDGGADPLRSPSSNWRFNLEKTAPEPVGRVLQAYLDKAGHLSLQTFASADADATRALASYRVEAVGHKHFSTYMIERLSELGTESLETEFGDRGPERARELHALAREAFEDRIVRDDTRIAFAINRLAQTSLATGSEQADLAALRASVGIAIRLVPWKFGLWRSAIRLACRAVAGEPRNEGGGLRWLEALLAHLTVAPTETTGWVSRWPEKDVEPDPETAALVVSFTRAAVWRTLAETLQELATQVRARTHWGWARRVLYNRDLAEVWTELADAPRWLACFYPRAEGPLASIPWWEADALTAYLLALAPLHTVLALYPVRTRQSEVWHSLAPTIAASIAAAGDTGTTGTGIMPWDALLLNAPLDDQLERLTARAAAASGPSGDPSAISRSLGTSDLLRKVPARWQGCRWPAHLHELHRTRLGLARVAPTDEGATIHRLLWGDWTRSTDLNQWRIRPAHAPVLALPAAVCQRLLAEGLSLALSSSMSTLTHPTWRFTERGEEVLASLRRAQLGEEPFEDTVVRDGLVVFSSRWEVPMHPAYRLLNMAGRAPSKLVARLWTNVLLFFTAAVGSERMLDAMTGRWAFGTTMAEDWEVRRIIPLSQDKWASLSRLLQACLALDTATAKQAAQELAKPKARKPLSALVGVDVWLTTQRNSPEFTWLSDLFPNFARELDTEELEVRLAQLSEHPVWLEWRKAYNQSPSPELSPADSRRIMVELTAALSSPSGPSTSMTRLGPVILPEAAIPPEYVSRLEAHVRTSGRAILGGQLFQSLPLLAPTRRAPPPRVRFLVNEAVFLCPLHSESDLKVASVRQFRITKPIPTHIEDALAADLAGVHARTWRVLRGNYWYRFVHPLWGDFTVAICSDLLDPRPWAQMSGRLLHLFMCAYNTDVELYDSLTWVRAYENYVNVASTNHGEVGGSFAWTPKGSHHRELARLRGGHLSLVADIRLPVASLFHEQHHGVEAAVARERARVWQERKAANRVFKAPPPSFRSQRRRGFRPPKLDIIT